MHIALVGMSNIGKSHWSHRLAAEAGYERVHCDALVEKKLGPELTRLGYAGIKDVAKWMGQPYDPQYPDTSRKYLDCEKQVMRDIIARLHALSAKPIVLDTTGSVIYTGADIIAELRALTRVVYFEASLDHVAHLFDRYMSNPKPVIWEQPMTVRAEETPRDALKRGYPELLASRAKHYAQMAHITIPYEQHKKPNADLHLLTGA